MSVSEHTLYYFGLIVAVFRLTISFCSAKFFLDFFG